MNAWFETHHMALYMVKEWYGEQLRHSEIIDVAGENKPFRIPYLHAKLVSTWK